MSVSQHKREKLKILNQVVKGVANFFKLVNLSYLASSKGRLIISISRTFSFELKQLFSYSGLNIIIPKLEFRDSHDESVVLMCFNCVNMDGTVSLARTLDWCLSLLVSLMQDASYTLPWTEFFLLHIGVSEFHLLTTYDLLEICYSHDVCFFTWFCLLSQLIYVIDCYFMINIWQADILHVKG